MLRTTLLILVCLCGAVGCAASRTQVAVSVAVDDRLAANVQVNVDPTRKE